MSRFLIDDLALRWIVTVLFGVAVADDAYSLVAQHGRWTSTVNRLLHQMMSLAMIVMVWPVGMDFPTVGPMVFFLVAAARFVLLACRVSCSTPERLTNGYYAVMMTAMAWMYVVMNDGLTGQLGHSPDRASWIITVNWVATAGRGFHVCHECALARLHLAPMPVRPPAQSD